MRTFEQTNVKAMLRKRYQIIKYKFNICVTLDYAHLQDEDSTKLCSIFPTKGKIRLTTYQLGTQDRTDKLWAYPIKFITLLNSQGY
jgi:hypothetical protein